jgi:hypothetical protein
MMRLLTFLLLAVGVSAFTSTKPWGQTSCAKTSARFMSSNDDEKAAAPAPTLGDEEPPLMKSSEFSVNTQMVRNLNTGKDLAAVYWLDLQPTK